MTRVTFDQLAQMTDAERKAAWTQREPEQVRRLTEALMTHGELRAANHDSTIYCYRVVGVIGRWSPWNWCAVYELVVESVREHCGFDGVLRRDRFTAPFGQLKVLGGVSVGR